MIQETDKSDQPQSSSHGPEAEFPHKKLLTDIYAMVAEAWVRQNTPQLKSQKQVEQSQELHQLESLVMRFLLRTIQFLQYYRYGMLPPEGAEESRKLVRKKTGNAWQTLLKIFDLLEHYETEKESPRTGIVFWAPGDSKYLKGHPLTDEVVNDLINRLSFFERLPTGPRIDENRLNDFMILGRAYECLLGLQITVDFKKGAYIRCTKALHKSQGSYHTPPAIMRYMNERIMGILGEQKDGKKLEGRTILDPAMGCGNFLLTAAHAVARTACGAEPLTSAQLQPVIRNQIYGVDIDPLAVHIARISLFLLSGGPWDIWYTITSRLVLGNMLMGMEYRQFRTMLLEENPAFREQFQSICSRYLRWCRQDEQESGGKSREPMAPELEKDLERCRKIADLCFSETYADKINREQIQSLADSLLKNTLDQPQLQQIKFVRRISEEHKVFHVELAFPEIFFQDSGVERVDGGFDVVLGNPPWKSFGLRGSRAMGRLEKESFQRRYAWSAEYKISTYSLFMHRAVELTRPGGVQSFIVPDSFLVGRYFSKLRCYLLEHVRIREMLCLEAPGWKDVHAGKNIIYLFEKTAPQKIEDCRPYTFHTLLYKNADSLGKAHEKRHEQSVSPALNTEHHRLRLYFDSHSERIIGAIERDTVSLDALMTFYSGLIGKRGQNSIVIPEKSTRQSQGHFAPLIESSKFLGRYSLRHNGKYMRKQKRLYKSGYEPGKYEQPKIMLNQTGYTLRACIDRQNYYCLNNIHIGFLTDLNYDLEFINALLCSKLINFYYRTISMEGGRALAQTDIETLHQLPVKKAPFSLTTQERLKFLEKFVNNYQRQLQYYIESQKFHASDEEAILTKEFDLSLQQEYVIGPVLEAVEQAPVFVKDGATCYHDSVSYLAELMILLKQEETTEPEVLIERVVVENFIEAIVYRLYGVSAEEVTIIDEAIRW